ncbi:hypothetical protein [Uliginosibacterium gangwonense]|uniref:hypothetical protein n=1 Tax=Uliginosibacterium gangwonense TaxID=392736 RepID=UPI0012F9B9C5|nr:hypothetical protein [Uliginosibacterium gangwonense]
MLFRLLASVFCFGVTQFAIAEMPVEISSTTPDYVGQRLVFALKEEIRRSTSLGITFDRNKPRLQVNIVTLDPNSSMPGYSTSYSMVILWNNPSQPFPFYLTQFVGTCGNSRILECADGLTANVSDQSDNMLKLFQSTKH